MFVCPCAATDCLRYISRSPSSQTRDSKMVRTLEPPSASRSSEAAKAWNAYLPESVVRPLYEAERRANQCVEKLENDPNDLPAREELAKLFALELERVDLALEALEARRPKSRVG